MGIDVRIAFLPELLADFVHAGRVGRELKSPFDDVGSLVHTGSNLYFAPVMNEWPPGPVPVAAQSARLAGHSYQSLVQRLQETGAICLGEWRRAADDMPADPQI